MNAKNKGDNPGRKSSKKLGKINPRQSRPKRVVEQVPDWLTKLLSKYGEAHGRLVGLAEDSSIGSIGSPSNIPVAEEAEEAAQLSALLEQMEEEGIDDTTSGRESSSVEWGNYDQGVVEEPSAGIDDLLSNLSLEQEDQHQPASYDEVPDWIGETFSDESVTELGSADVIYNEASTNEVANIEDLGFQEEVPDWLDEMAPGAEASSKPPIRSSGVSASETSAGEEAIPDWLMETLGDAPGEPISPVGVEEKPPTTSVVEEDVPDWLIDALEEEPTTNDPSISSDTALPVASEDEAVPDWLMNAIEEKPADNQMQSPSVTELPFVEEEIPDWLNETDSQSDLPEVDAPADFEEPVDDTSTPDWLNELVSESTAGEVTRQIEAEDQLSDDVAVPDWLTEIAPGSAETSEPEESSVVDMTDESSSLFDSQTASPASDLDSADWEVPDWLREESSSETGGETDEEEIPDWLTQPDSAVDAGYSDLPEIEESDIPDWLTSESASLDPASEISEAPDTWLDNFDTATSEERLAEPGESTDLEADDDWLADLAAPSRPADSAPSTAASPDALSDDDWLESLGTPSETTEISPHETDATAALDDDSWLAALDNFPDSEESGSSTAAEKIEPSDQDDWLAALDVSESPAAVTPEASSTDDDLSDFELPANFASPETTEPFDMGASAAVSDEPISGPSDDEAETIEDVVDEEVPDWLAEEAITTVAVSSLSERLDEASADEETVDTAAEPESDMYDWLSSLRDSDETTEDVFINESEPEDPDWLADDPAADEVKFPDWLVDDTETEAQTTDEPKIEAEIDLEVPDRPSETLEAAETPLFEPAEEESSIPDWLNEPIADEELIVEEAEPAEAGKENEQDAAIPDWLMEPAEIGQETAAAQTLETEAEGIEMDQQVEKEAKIPDWLSDLPEPADEPVSDQVSDTLTGTSEEITENVQVEDPGLPDWLFDLPDAVDDSSPDISEAEPATAKPVQPEEDVEIPGWLSEPPDDDDESTSWAFEQEADAPEAPVEITSQVKSGQSPDTPDWLAEEPDLPDWLSDPAQPSETEAIEPAETEEEAEMPDWLSELPETPADISVPQTAEPNIVSTAESEEETALPDWLDGPSPEDEDAAVEPLEADAETDDVITETVQAEEESDLPDWLPNLAEISEDIAADQPAEIEELLETPDWLSDSEQVAEIQPELQSETIESTEIEEDTDGPDWLSELTEITEGSDVAESDQPEVDETVDTPDWLTEEADIEMPDWLSGSAQTLDPEVKPETTEPTEADGEELEMPDWLFELADVDDEPVQVSEVEQTESEPESWDLLTELPSDNETGQIPETKADSAEAKQELELPDWSFEDSDLETVDTMSSEIEEDPGIPDWLASMPDITESTTGLTAEPESDEAAEAEETADMPNLPEASEDLATVPETPVPEEGAPEAAGIIMQSEAKDALDELDRLPEETDLETPNWRLDTDQPLEDEPVAAASIESGVEPTDTMEAGESLELPDRLTDLPEASEDLAADRETPVTEEGASEPSVGIIMQSETEDALEAEPDTGEAAEPEVEPTDIAQADEEPDLPDWLTDLPQADQDLAAAQTIEADTPETSETEEEFDMPDWLMDTTDKTSEAEIQAESIDDSDSEEDLDIPDWLTGLREASDETDAISAETTETEEVLEMSGWFSNSLETSEAEGDVTETTEPEEELDMPDWLLDIPDTSEESTAIQATQPEDSLMEDETESAEAIIETAQPEANEPPGNAWLEEDLELEMPDWLLDSEIPEAEAESNEIEETDEALRMPDWLTGLPETSEELAAVQATETKTPETIESEEDLDMPDWLSDVGQPLEAEQVTAETAEADVELTEITEAEESLEMLNWLTDLPEVSDETAMARETPSTEEGTAESLTGITAPGETEEKLDTLDWLPEETDLVIPDWLSDTDRPLDVEPETGESTEPDIESTGIAEAEETDLEMPDWLTDLPKASADLAAAQPIEADTPETSEAEEDLDRPDWLTDIEPVSETEFEPTEITQAEEEIDTPDWLAELPEPGKEPAITATSEAEPVETMESEDELEIPDWLISEPPEVKEEEIEQPADVESLQDISEPAEVEEESEVPDWLADLPDFSDETTTTQAVEAETAQATEIEEELETPPWLTGLDDNDEEAETAAGQAPEVIEPEIEAAANEDEIEAPDWLSDLPGIDEIEEESSAEASELAAESTETEELAEALDVPAWLLDASEAGLEIPDWLKESTKPELEPSSEVTGSDEPSDRSALVSEAQVDEEEAEQPIPSEIGAELSEIGVSQDEVSQDEVSLSEVSEEESSANELREVNIAELEESLEMPNWLTDSSFEEIASPDWLLDESETSESEMADISLEPSRFSSADISPAPDREVNPEEESTQIEEMVSPDSMAEAVSEENAWVADDATLSSTVEEGSGEVKESPSGLLAGASVAFGAIEALKPGREPALDEDNLTSESTGMLAGLPTLLPAEKTPLLSGMDGQIDDMQAAAQQFYAIATQAPQPAILPAPLSQREKLVGTIVRSALTLLFIALIALPLFPGTQKVVGGNMVPWTEPTEQWSDVLDNRRRQMISEQIGIIDLQPPGSVALVSFDYRPATEGEMTPLAEAVIGRLKGQGMRIIGMSLDPEGAVIAQKTLDNILASRNETYGENTVNLGYLSGQVAAVRELVTGEKQLAAKEDFKDGVTFDHPSRLAWADIKNFDQVNLVVTIADNPATVRWWAEQLSVAPQPEGNERFVLAATSATAAPFLGPYRATNQLNGLISGINGAAAIESVRNNFGLARQMLDSQSIAHLIIVILIAIGTMVGWMPPEEPTTSETLEKKDKPKPPPANDAEISTTTDEKDRETADIES